MLNLSEIFFSIQGESTYTGLPCIFIRCAKCNLRCQYCDTTYSYNAGYEMNNQSVLSEIKKYLPVKLVQITGGEPLLQNEIYSLVTMLNEMSYKVLLETNGSVLVDKIPDYVIKILDVKCPSSGYSESFTLKNLNFINPKDELKFVISNRQDYDYTLQFIELHLSSFSNTILLSPVTNKLAPQELARWVLTDKLPVRIQLQLHKIIWGEDIRGV